MQTTTINSQLKINEKSSRKFFGVLRRLAKADSSLNNKMKVTVFKDDNNEEKNYFFIASSFFLNPRKHFIPHYLAENTCKSKIEKLIIEKKIENIKNTELIDYPNSSDFDDD